MSEMVDRVGKVLVDALHGGNMQPSERLLGVARAAILAMREPTPDQQAAGGAVAPEALRMMRHSGEIRIGMENAASVWREMIDEALR